jgi:Zn-dependent protease
MALTFTYHEIIDLTKSFLGVSLIFWWVMGGVPILHALPFIAFVVGVAFVLHELAHKAMATHYGYKSEYHSNDKMLFASVFLALFNIIFLAPGAVQVEGVRKMKHLGIISIVGPLTNVVLALCFAIIMPVIEIARFGFEINAWLAFFNMLPIFGMDGEKVWAWNKVVFGITAAVVLAIYAWTYF